MRFPQESWPLFQDVIDKQELWGWGLAALLAAFFSLRLVARLIARRIDLWRRHRRQRRARRGELDAEGVLRVWGYRLEDSQVFHRWTVHVDGEPVEVELFADHIVTRGGRRFVAEVKTGQAAPSIRTAATRRQLLEYRCAFDVDGVLLVDMEEGTIHEVDFPL